MTDFVVLTIPIFGVVLLGWLSAKFNFLPDSALSVLSAYSFKFALPALVFKLIASQPLSQSLSPVFYFAYLISGATVMSFMYLAFRVLGKKSSR